MEDPTTDDARRLHRLLQSVPFTPLCWQDARGYSLVVLYVADALMRPYGYASSFFYAGAAQRGLPPVVDGVVAFMRRLDAPVRAQLQHRKADPPSGDRA